MNSRSARQEIIRILWNTKVRYRVHKRNLLVPTLSHMNPIRTSPHCLYKIHSTL